MLNEIEENSSATEMSHAAAIETPGTILSEAKKIAPVGKPAIVEEVLIEEVSIDGMCGVY